MREDERLQLVSAVSEAHASLQEAALRLRRELPGKDRALKAALKAEREAFRLKKELQRLDLAEPDRDPRHQSLPEVRQGSKVVDISRLRPRKDRGGER